MNPPLLMPLVEITPGAYTEPRVVQLVVGLMKRCGKHPIELPHELPGFVCTGFSSQCFAKLSRLSNWV
jgi:3-hydroxyacyl-CoA dehydrogenase